MTDTLTELEKVRGALQVAGETCAYEYAYSVATLCKESLTTLDTIIAKQKATEQVIEAVRVRLMQIASGDYRACGHLAEAVALDALDKINALFGKEFTE